MAYLEIMKKLVGEELNETNTMGVGVYLMG